jgi:hypothetical protein
LGLADEDPKIDIHARPQELVADIASRRPAARPTAKERAALESLLYIIATPFIILPSMITLR